MKSLRLALALTLLLLVACALFRARGPGRVARELEIIYTGDFDWQLLPRLATVIRQEQPTLALSAGRILAGTDLTYLFQGQAEVTALSASGVNCVCLTPDLLRLGLPAARHLIDSIAPNVFFLGANLLDSIRRTPIGQAFSKPGGASRLALIGLLTDSTSPYLRQPGIVWQNPGEVGRRTIPIAALSSELVGLVTFPGQDLDLPGADFILGVPGFRTGIPKPNTVLRLTLQLGTANQVLSLSSSEVHLVGFAEDERVAQIVRDFQRQADSVAHDTIDVSEVELDVRTLRRILTRTALRLARADGAVFGNELVLTPLIPGPITLHRVGSVIASEDQLVRVRVVGEEFGRIARPGEPAVEWRGTIKRMPVPRLREYKLVTTLNYARSHPLFMNRRLEFLPLTLTQALTEGLRPRSSPGVLHDEESNP
ncbi:MAG: hypothetical protein ABIK62_05760 [candidate division WOR-3 bacterium]